MPASNRNLKTPSIKKEKLFHYEESILINNPIREVWEYMDNIENSKDYQSFLKSVFKSPRGPIKVGTVLTYNFKILWKKFTNIYKVIDYIPPYRMSFVSLKESAVKATGSNIFEPINDSTTRLKMIFNPKLADFFKNKSDKKVDKIYNKTLTKVLRKIKRKLEKKT